MRSEAILRRRVLSAICLAAALAGCEKPAPAGWQGYIEGEYVLLAAPAAGQLVKRHLSRGEEAKAGQPAFVLEQENETAARSEAEARAKGAEARLANLGAARRTPELDAIRAQIEQARAARALSASELARQEKLFAAGYVSRPRVDEARAALERDSARIAEAEAQLKNASQPLGRDPEREAARADIAAARAASAQAAWRLGQKSIAVPVAGIVQESYFNEGEWVPAGRPVLSILPPGNVKARFYVPEPALSGLSPGTRLMISCDGCGEPIAATVRFVSPQAEYTPPVLYNRESRAKLVFLVEARPDAPSPALRPGLPVDVRPASR